MTDTTVPVACPSCNAWEPQPLFQGYDRLLGHPGTFTICACKRCGLIYLNPRPLDLMRYYQGEYLPFLQYTPRGLVAFIQKIVPQRSSRRVRVLSQLAGEVGRVLDIGCAGGDFLFEMSEAGWDVAGVEPSDTAAAIAAQRFPGRIAHGTLDTVRYPDNSFDLVTMWDVVEHLTDPRATLKEIRRILRPGGALFIQTPRANSIDARFFGTAWVGWECPRHLCIFSGTTLKRMLHQAGFTAEEKPQLMSSHWVWALSCRFWIQEHVGPHVGERLYHWLTRRPVRLVLTPFFSMIDRRGIGSLLTMIAFRKD